MRRPVRVLRRAQDDLLEIHRYIGRDRPTAADRMLDSLIDSIGSLARFPGRGLVPRDDRLRSLKFRVLSEGDYLVFYKVLTQQVRIYRVIHGKRRCEHLL